MRRIATILARGGSKGVPGKNIRPLAGKPLIARSVEQALASGCFDDVVVSSDCEDILAAAGAAGARHLVRRPAELATDSAAKLPGIRHAVAEWEAATGQSADLVADLAVTSPMRAVEDIRGALALLDQSGAPNVVSGHACDDNPYYTVVELSEAGDIALCKTPPQPIFRRQDAPPCYVLNGAVYVWRRAALFNGGNSSRQQGTRLYVMPRERGLDIDSEIQFRFISFLLSEHGMIGA
jgi:CMP-N,N'-diacetyllegionaminic acid synthase